MNTVRTLFVSVAVTLLSVASGCKKDTSPGSPGGTGSPTINSFTATPSSVQAGGDSVTLSWRVSGAVSLSISPGVGTISPPDSGTRRVFVAATTTFTLTATNSAGSTNANANVSVASSLTVNGFVKDQNGEPVAGKPVIVTGKPSVLSASDGSFSISNVTSPYEITVIAIIGALKIAVTYQGLTRPDPVLAYPGGPTGIQKNATISGTVPAAPSSTTHVFFISGDRSWSTTADPGGLYSIFPSWYGPVVISGQIHVLRHPSAPAIPTSYDAYGSRPLTISDGATFGNNDFLVGDLSNPTEQSISGTVVRPGGYTLDGRSHWITFGGARLEIGEETTPSDTFSFAAPNISGAMFGVYAWASATTPTRYSNSWEAGLTPGTSGVNVNLETTAQLALPINNGTNIDTSTLFQWTQGSGNGVNLVYITAGVSPPQYWIYTSGSSTRIPNLSSQGLGLPPSTSYTWYIDRYVPVASVNDAASDAFRGFIGYNAGDYRYNESEVFNFTTRP